jgi:beta-N-acetylhexosaminidase
MKLRPILLFTLLAGAPFTCAGLFPDPIEEFAKIETDRIVSQMTLEQKVGQLIHIGMSGKTAGPQLKSDIEKYHVGGVILFEANLGTEQEITALTSTAQSWARESKPAIPLLFSIDQEGGRVVRVKQGVEQLPGALAMGQAEQEGLAEDAGFLTARGLVRLGIPFLLAPDVDVNNNPANPVINTRSYGADPAIVTRMALAYARGAMAGRAIPVLKHFPGHGNTNTDSHTALPTVRQTLEEMEKVELVPYRAGIQQQMPVIMSAHIVFPALDPSEPATLSPKILRDFLRGQMGYQGIVITDALEMKAVADRYPVPVLAHKVFQAGVDIQLLTSSGERTRLLYESLLKGFQSGQLSTAELDESVKRQVRLKLRYGLFHRYGMVEHPAGMEAIKSAEERLGEREAELSKKYPDGLNCTLSRAGVSSLRKGYAGLSPDAKAKSRLLLRMKVSVEEARSAGIPEDRITITPAPASTAAVYVTGVCAGPAGCPSVLFVELGDFDIWRWNQLVAQARTVRAQGRAVPELVGLFSGNPYQPIRIPEHGAVLASFSPTEESMRALVYRAVSGLPVKQGNLILPGEL